MTQNNHVVESVIKDSLKNRLFLNLNILAPFAFVIDSGSLNLFEYFRFLTDINEACIQERVLEYIDNYHFCYVFSAFAVRA